MQWVCDICGYLHDDEEEPVSCPVCGADAGKFSEYYGDDEEGHAPGRRVKERDDFDNDLFADYEDE